MSLDLLEVYRALRRHNGHLNWWPGRTRLDVILGAILTQNTAWTNVERALANLRSRGWLNLRSLRGVRRDRLAAAIRPSGYYRQKARKLKAFIAFLDQTYAGSLQKMARAETGLLRRQLLDVWGIGAETADSILLYAFHRPVFVVDAYTQRVMARHGWGPARAGYEELRGYFETSLPPDVENWNDFHAQFVWLGKHHCRPRPQCAGCPLESYLPPDGPRE
ncbi:MAG: hypothetical protein GF355_04135 [Candidatus Eisenbacteria bacterium]|nr:hypothetical protein [Candidatus Eisenbacteria bacterium]